MCKKEPFWAKKDVEKWSQLQFNLKYLRKQKIEHGDIHCEYCGKENLKIYDWCERVNHNDVATVDHFYPKSKYEDLKKDEKNFIIACYSCNSKKKDNLWETNKIKFPLEENKIKQLQKIN
jgi:5-methylcytosine-specific restriction endonuclease McrA